MTHADAIELIRQGGNTVRLLVKRGSRLSQPTCKYDLVNTLNKMKYLKVPYLDKENFDQVVIYASFSLHIIRLIISLISMFGTLTLS